MRRRLTYFSTSLIFCLLLLSIPYNARTAKAADPVEKCNDCIARIVQHFQQCQAVFGDLEPRCYDEINRETINCYRNFCEP
jgi:hypothetical protein